jgi:type III restriction enzyme
MVFLEMKGAEFDMDHAKYQAPRRWVSAVNNWGRLGRWDFMVCRDPLALPGMLAKHDA